MEHVSIDKNKNIIQNIRNKNEAVFIIIVKRKVYLSICIMFIRLNWKTILNLTDMIGELRTNKFHTILKRHCRYCFK